MATIATPIPNTPSMTINNANPDGTLLLSNHIMGPAQIMAKNIDNKSGTRMAWPARIPATRMINQPAVAKNEMPDVLEELATMMFSCELEGNFNRAYYFPRETE